MLDSSISIKTVFCDIDGVIFKHFDSIDEVVGLDPKQSLLPGVIERFQEWANKGYTVILTTGRPNSLRKLTKKQIMDAGLYFDMLIMSLPRGPRIVINDRKTNSQVDTADAINLDRNIGLKNVIV